GLAPLIAAGEKPPVSLQISGVNGVGARPPSQNCRKYLKSANTVRYLSQRSRSNEPYRYSRSVGARSGVRSAKLNAARSKVIPVVPARFTPARVLALLGTNCVSVNALAEACGVGVSKPPTRLFCGCVAKPRK